MRLTDDAIRRRKRPTTGQQFLWDDLVAGFGVRFTSARTTFVCQWRTADGKKPRKSLRPHWPQLIVAAAHDRARAELAEVVAITEAAGAAQLRHGMRPWFERKSEFARWRPATAQRSIRSCAPTSRVRLMSASA